MSSDKPNVTLELSLLDNGINFIHKGIDELFDNDYALIEYSNAQDISANGYKYGVLHLFSGFLLLLKERLYRHVPELIFKGNLKDAKRQVDRGKTPNTVNLDEALERLEAGPRITFTEKDIEVIRRVQTARNQFEHYKVSFNRLALWKEVSNFLELIDNFLINELQVNIEDAAQDFELRRKIKEIGLIKDRIKRQFSEAWTQDVQKRLRKFKRNPQRAVQTIEGEYRSGDGEGYPYTICPDCGQDTLVVYGEFEGICSNKECRSVNPITACLRCGTPMPGASWDDGDFCDICHEWMLSD